MLRITAKRNATRWTRTRLQYGPFVFERREVWKILVRGTTPKPNGEQWYGWFVLDEINIEETP